MRYIKGSTADHDDEVDEAKWFAIDEALRVMSYPSERAMMRRAKAILSRRKAV